MLAQREAEAEALARQQAQEKEAADLALVKAAIAAGNKKEARRIAFDSDGPVVLGEYIDAYGPDKRMDIATFGTRLSADNRPNTKGWAAYRKYKTEYEALDAQAEARAAARAQAEYERQLEIAAQMQREADRAAYAQRNKNWAIEKYGDDRSTYDQAMQNLRDTYRQNLQRYNEGGNIWVLDDPDN